MKKRILAGFTLWAFATTCSAVSVAASHTNKEQWQPLPLHIGGRVSVEQPGQTDTKTPFFLSEYPTYRYQWPGTYFEARFSGDRISYKFNDKENRFRVFIDGMPSPHEPNRPGDYFEIAAPEKGSHTIRIERVSETQHGTGTFGGFFIRKDETPLPPPERTRQIEFIGDSFANGYGITSPKHECTDDEVYASTDASKAWTVLSAKHADADYQINAYSGIGLMRNYDGTTEPVMTGLYPYTLFDKSVKYDDANWHPQLIVIALGENDFSPPWPGKGPWATADVLRPDFIATFVTFIQDLRAHNPNARVLLLDYGTPEVVADLKGVAGALAAQGVTGVETFHAGDNFAMTGCNWHLDVADHQRIATTLNTWIDTHPDVWAKP